MVIHFGVKEIDKEGVSMWKAADIGKAVFDPDFNLYQRESQKALLDLCVDLRKQDFVLNEEVRCWIETFAVYVKA